MAKKKEEVEINPLRDDLAASEKARVQVLKNVEKKAEQATPKSFDGVPVVPPGEKNAEGRYVRDWSALK